MLSLSLGKLALLLVISESSCLVESYAHVATFPKKGKATDSRCQLWRPHLTGRALTAASCKAVACPPARTAGG